MEVVIKQFVYRKCCAKTQPRGVWEEVNTVMYTELFIAKLKGISQKVCNKWSKYKPELAEMVENNYYVREYINCI